MTAVLIMLSIQSLLGAFDNLWHHEITEDLTHRPEARGELMLHTAREFLYALIFTSIAWVRWEGAWAFVFIGILGLEIIITLWDFVIEDQTRKLPAFERVLHTVLAINFGAILAVWVPQLTTWIAAPTGFGTADYGILSWLMTAFGTGVFAWALHDLGAVVRLGVPEWQRQPMRAGEAPLPLTVLVTGATGFIGRPLVRALIERGDRVVVLARSPAKARDRFGPLVEIVADLKDIAASRSIDAIVNLAGEPLAGGLWTQARKQRFLGSRLGTTDQILALIERLDQKPEALISGSAIGYYGDRGDEALTEASGAQPMFMSDLCRLWEDRAAQAEAFGVRVCRLRIGLVLGRDGGAVMPLALTTKLGVGSIMGDGRQVVSWIHRADLIRLIQFALDDQVLRGPVNAVAPGALSHEQFMHQLAAALHRRIRFRLPAMLLRTMLGGLSALFLTSQRVVPQRALDAGFRFDFPDIDQAFAELYGRIAAPKPDAGIAVYMNDSCSICRVELEHYEAESARDACAITFNRLGRISTGLAAYGLSDADLRRRLYAVDASGQMRSGVDAFIAVWATLPRYRWAARAASLPGIHALLGIVYEGFCVPFLAAWNRRKPAGVQS